MKKNRRLSWVMVLVVCVAMICLNFATSVSQAQGSEKLVIRFATDHSATQASAYAEMDVLGKAIKERIPGAQFRTYFGSSLYKPVETMNQLTLGNLEMGTVDSDGAAWDPWCYIWSQPMVLTTFGAHVEYPTTSVANMFVERMAKKGIKVMGWEMESTYGGIACSKRLLTLGDLKGKKIRISAALTQGPLVESWGASPVSLAWGDVPNALQSGVVDGVITSVGGWRSIKEMAPYYTVFGVGGVFTDFYMIMVSEKWWNSLDEAHQDALREAINYHCAEFPKIQYAEDQLGYKELGTKDPSKPGIYLATPEQVAPLKEAVGTSIVDSLVKALGEDARPWIQAFNDEGAELVNKWPIGSHPVEKTNPEDYRKLIRMD